MPDTGQKFDLAIKMMFNYHVNSNADAILREMERETVPALLSSPGEQVTWDTGHKVRKKMLPPHPNIVTMWGLFVDQVPNLPDNVLNYPAALPQRIHAEGIGKNMTLFLVMKKYPTTLKDYLSVVNLTLRERLVLLTQLLEGVAHMGAHGITHRDMKCDNILLDIDTGFGCCLADNTYGLVLPYTIDLIDRGGNTAVMAPEIATAEPGRFTQLDYRKADAWSAGALAYEIFGADNPFYNTGQGRLDSRSYRLDELPHLPDDVPAVVQRVVAAREPKKAADILHLLLWAPSDLLLPCSGVPRSKIRWWMVTMATEVHLEKKSTLREMKRCFLDHLNINSLLNAFSYCGVNIISK
ncbi:serine/threonine-protein kinase Pink1, mitochondrial-like [Dreissena polymorpha]|uniref:serine/threonine-protein kinase Pink1, mitochondrial-like n=1 Tax=Dreissena polymorpha TaxID=45954 RepID=UPI002263C2C4|nr:serine/threonine-protein kinase Pink1, mitochondrial-like [Dreissena polymorpha]